MKDYSARLADLGPLLKVAPMTGGRKPKFTPGPWELQFDDEPYWRGTRHTGVHFVLLHDGTVIRGSAASRMVPTGYSNDEARANARLIAEAPAMYEALREIGEMAPLDSDRVTELCRNILARIDGAS